MLLNAKEIFRLKSARDGGAKKLYLEYLEITRDNDFMPCKKSIPYLKAFVQYPPSVCQWIIRESNGSYFTLSSWGDEYLYLISVIAAYHLDLGQKIEGLHWAVEAVYLFDYFSPTLDKTLREKSLREMTASRMICTYPVESMLLKPIEFFLDWQTNHYHYYGQAKHFNDN